MNDKRASRRVCANCKSLWADVAMVKRDKRYICPKCLMAEKQTRVQRRTQARAKRQEGEVTA